jgi:hypothetical protein
MYKIVIVVLGMFILGQVNGQTPDEIYLFSTQIEHALKRDSTTDKYAAGAWGFAATGHYLKALQTWDLQHPQHPKLTSADSAYFRTFKPQLASEYLINRAEKERIIILDEARFNPRHRVFMLSLLGGMYRQGFHYLAVGALADTGVNHRKYPLLSSGKYVPEPQYGELIREAVRLGFRLLVYDSGAHSSSKEQAQNIQKTLLEDQNAKILILADLLQKPNETTSNNIQSLANEIKSLTNITPFTIDQVANMEHSEKKLNSAFLDWLTPDESLVMVNEEGKPFNGLASSTLGDCQVFHPFTHYRQGRGDWMFLQDRRRAYNLPAAMLTVTYPCIVSAYRQGEHKNAVPTDVVEFTSAAHHVPLVLVRGEYRIEVRDHLGARQVLEIRVR